MRGNNTACDDGIVNGNESDDDRKQKAFRLVLETIEDLVDERGDDRESLCLTARQFADERPTLPLQAHPGEEFVGIEVPGEMTGKPLV